MDKKRKWQWALILAVIALTVYNILPTVFYYTKPLKAPISSSQANEISHEIANRVDQLESESIDWLHSYCELIHVSPLSIVADPLQPGQITLTFAKTEEALALRKHLPRAASLIPFFPAQLGVASDAELPKQVVVQRRIPLRLASIPELFTYIPKSSDEYKAFIGERVQAIHQSMSRSKLFSVTPQDSAERLLSLASSLQTLSKLYDERQEIAVRYAQSQSVEGTSSGLIAAFDQFRDQLKKQKGREGITEEQKKAIEAQELKVTSAETFVKKHTAIFAPKSINPFFQEISVDWNNDQIELKLHPDLLTQKSNPIVEQLLIDQVALIARDTHETIKKTSDGYSIPLQTMPNTTGFLVLKLHAIAKQQAEALLHSVQSNWHPTHPDLQQLKIVTSEQYLQLPLQDQALCLIVSAPAAEEQSLIPGLHNQSIYLFAKGIGRVLKSYQENPDSEQAQLFIKEFRQLANHMGRLGFTSYPVSLFDQAGQDYVFEQRNFASGILAATRENFALIGDQKKAILELSDVEQRILTVNKIETQIHEDLIKWNDEFRSAQVSINPAVRYDVPKPTRSVFWSNLDLSLRKLFRGDDRKILRWGLDLSGGKTVQIELRDQNNRLVTDDADLKQGINELFNRVNKMGVSDVSIRQVGHQIVLDFPGGQALSASELVKASSMYFHIVNERFAPQSALSESTNRFLQEVWNEAVVSNRTDPQSVHAIAYRHLYGDSETTGPRSDAGRILYEQGLRLADPKDYGSSQAIDESISKIALLRGSDYTEWQGQTHPLLIVFRNYALEGSQLDNIRGNYDPSKGNFLSFEVKGSTPRTFLHQWTSLFSKEKILGTARETPTHGRGWRMAVLLNDTVISAPTLESALRDSASITGSFSQREVNQLVSDLKAGSLTFTPHILSEKNVSPELGKSDRMQGIVATGVALFLVIGSMVLYYRFAGLVASIAVLFNLLILWATLQNLGASLSLAGIAGIILTVGMAVDANVLVFERIKEEFAVTKKISSAIHAGYEKAFSAILDSNITTIIAALILLNFDSGPIKAFAISMIIGIASSMFTALFMTRFYFTGWLRNPKNQSLSMANWIDATNIDFLKKAKAAFAIAIGIIVIGGGFLGLQRSTILGMDFTGGYALHLEVEGQNNPVSAVENALQKGGAATRDFQIRQHNPSTQLRILFGTSMEQAGKPFHNLPLEVETPAGSLTYKKNPRIDWVVQTLQNGGVQLTPASLQSLDTNWTAMSGQMSESMRNNALIGLAIAFVSIFIYIAFRFEYKYAISAIICLLHDVLITLGLMGILHAFKIPVQIDLNTIAAIMTIIGYSLNDTIIIFDRIREDVQLYKKLPMHQIVNRALNSTLSRTAITSGTTLLVLLALVALGGASIFSFSLVMVIGVVFGTLSSWFIAAPLLLFFHRKEEAKEQIVQTS